MAAAAKAGQTPNPYPAPKAQGTALASGDAVVSETQMEVGAPPIITGSTPIPAPNPHNPAASAPVSAATASAAQPGPITRIWKMFKK